MAIRVPADTKQPIMMMQLPLGIYLPAGISLQFGDEPAKLVPYAVCRQAGCMADYPITEAELAAMQQGAELRLSAQTENQPPGFAVQVPVAGFGAAYAKIR